MDADLMTFSEYIKNYSEDLYKMDPIFFEYLELNNSIAGYIEQIYDNISEYLNDNYEYSEYVYYYDFVNICSQILANFGNEYQEKFIKYLSDGTINLKEYDSLSFSYTKVTTGNIDINISKQYNVQDVIATIHEFFHAIHLEKYDNQINNINYYYFTETIAIIGELYSVFYLYQNNIMKEDVITYFKEFFISMYSRSDITLLEGIVLDLYDKMQSVKENDLKSYIKFKNLPNGYENILSLFNDIDEFTYHEEVIYTFAFPISFIIAKHMIDDKFYINQFNSVFKSINNFNLNSTLNLLGIDKILNDSEYLYHSMNYINDIIDKIMTNKAIDKKYNYSIKK